MPSKVSKRGIVRYRASVTVRGHTLQKMYPDESKKSYQAALIWEKETKRELERKLSQTGMESLAIGTWSNEYLTEAENRFAKATFDEKKSAFARFYKDMASVGISDAGFEHNNMQEISIGPGEG